MTWEPLVIFPVIFVSLPLIATLIGAAKDKRLQKEEERAYILATPVEELAERITRSRE